THPNVSLKDMNPCATQDGHSSHQRCNPLRQKPFVAQPGSGLRFARSAAGGPFMRFRITLILAGTLLAMACGNSPTGPSGASGNFNMMIKDSPFADAKAVIVTFSKVSVHKDTDTDGTWIDLTFRGGAGRRSCDLKKLETAQDLLGVGALTAGHYTQVRLVVQSAKLYFQNASALAPCAATFTEPAGDNASLTIPSGEVKLN